MESKNVILIEPESMLVVTRDLRLKEVGKCWSKGSSIQLHKMSKSGNLMKRIVTTANHTVFFFYLKLAKRVYLNCLQIETD